MMFYEKFSTDKVKGKTGELKEEVLLVLRNI